MYFYPINRTGNRCVRYKVELYRLARDSAGFVCIIERWVMITDKYSPHGNKKQRMEYVAFMSGENVIYRGCGLKNFGYSNELCSSFDLLGCDEASLQGHAIHLFGTFWRAGGDGLFDGIA